MRQKILLFFIASVLILGIYTQPDKAMAQEISEWFETLAWIRPSAPIRRGEIARFETFQVLLPMPEMVKPVTVMFNKVTIKGGSQCAVSAEIEHRMTGNGYAPLAIGLDPSGQSLLVNGVTFADNLPVCFQDTSVQRVLVEVEGKIDFISTKDSTYGSNSPSPPIGVGVFFAVTDKDGKTLTVGQHTVQALEHAQVGPVY